MNNCIRKTERDTKALKAGKFSVIYGKTEINRYNIYYSLASLKWKFIENNKPDKTMNNNDILRSLRYTFDFNDVTMIEIFGQGGLAVSRAEVSDWLKKEDQEDYKPINDFKLATFLNGLINLKRGKQEGKQAAAPEKQLTNNIILRKIKIALDLRDDDMMEILSKAGQHLSRHELSAFFRNPSQSQYRPCLDQVLRNFLRGLHKKYRQ